MSERLQETVLLEQTARVDRERGIIRNLKIVGTVSPSGRRYPAATLAKARGLFEGARVNVDRLPKGASRRAEDRFGVLENVSQRSDGSLQADLKFLANHEVAERVCESIERGMGILGLQHDASGRVAKRDGREIVEEIGAVHGVDLIAPDDPSGGLSESIKTLAKPSEPTLQEFKTPGTATGGPSVQEFLRDVRK